MSIIYVMLVLVSDYTEVAAIAISDIMLPIRNSRCSHVRFNLILNVAP